MLGPLFLETMRDERLASFQHDTLCDCCSACACFMYRKAAQSLSRDGATCLCFECQTFVAKTFSPLVKRGGSERPRVYSQVLLTLQMAPGSICMWGVMCRLPRQRKRGQFGCKEKERMLMACAELRFESLPQQLWHVAKSTGQARE